MAYSRNPMKVELILDDLRPLLDRRSCRWLVNAGDAENWAFRVREARAIILSMPTRWPQLAAVVDNYSIEIISKTTVQARWVGPDLDLEAAPEYSRTGVASAGEIIGHWSGLQPYSGTLTYPLHKLSDDEIKTLAQWASEIEWLVIKLDGGLILTPYAVDLVRHAVTTHPLLETTDAD